MKKIGMCVDCIWAFSLCILFIMLSGLPPVDGNILWFAIPIVSSGLFAALFVLFCARLIKEELKEDDNG